MSNLVPFSPDRILEQRHAEKVRELTLQVKAEQDALAVQNTSLERKVASLEEEEAKCKNIIAQLEMENRMLEQEHRAVVDQLAAVQLVKDKLERDLESLSGLQQKVRSFLIFSFKQDHFFY